MSALTPEAAAAKMRQLSKDYGDDLEEVHGYMDDFLCSLLLDLGYKEVVAMFEDQDKWYA